jgi:hypothetical protein
MSIMLRFNLITEFYKTIQILRKSGQYTIFSSVKIKKKCDFQDLLKKSKNNLQN